MSEPTTSLRSRVVEAGARAIEQAPGSYTVEMDTEAAAQAALDAMLDCLAENADEWAEETRVPTLVGGDALALLAALGEDR